MVSASAIELLRAVALSPECEKMNRSTVKGYLGELLVKAYLESEGKAVEHFGNQSGFDLQFFDGNRLVKIDVKMSMPKDERKWNLSYWSWALKHEAKKKAITATHFICLGCTERLEVDSLFVVRAGDVHEFPPATGQFSKVQHCLFIPRPNAAITAAAAGDSLYQKCQELLAARKVISIPHGTSLAQACA